ncbi:hypothetical protein IFM89_031128, partial [Coptis chinensis]
NLNGKTEELVEVYHILSSKKDYFLNKESYNMMISFLCTAGQVKRAYAVLLKGSRDSGDTEMAIENVQWIADNSSSILQVASAELVSSLYSSLKPEKFIQLIRVMMGKGLVSYNDTSMDVCDGISLTLHDVRAAIHVLQSYSDDLPVSFYFDYYTKTCIDPIAFSIKEIYFGRSLAEHTLI